MKNKLIIILCLVMTFSLKVKSQNMGAITVNKNFTATLNFAEEIDIVVTGNNPEISQGKFKYYDLLNHGKAVFIRSDDPNSPQTSITVKLVDGAIWFGTLQYGENDKIFYDYAKIAKQKEIEIEKEAQIIEDKNNTKMMQRVESLMKMQVEYTDLGIIENRMALQVSNIINDENYTYFKIIVANNSASDYIIDNIGFRYVEGKRKGIKRKEAVVEERINPVYETPKMTVKAYSTEEIGYVIPLFTVGSRGNLIVQMFEKNGTRNPQFKIAQSILLKIKIF